MSLQALTTGPAALLAAFSANLALGTMGAFLWAKDAFGDAGGLIAAVAYG